MKTDYENNWRGFYETRAHGYEKKARLFSLLYGGFENHMKRCSELLNPQTGECIVDLGCGTGSLIDFLSPRLGPDGNAIGIDLAKAMIEFAQARKRDSLARYVCADAKTTNLPSGYCDAVCIIAVLHEMLPDERKNLLAEAMRLLKPGGRLLVGEHSYGTNTCMKLVGRFLFRIISAPAERPRLDALLALGMQNLLQESGFAIEVAVPLPLGLFVLTKARKPLVQRNA